MIPLIETQEGCENFAEIAAVDGIDFAFFGFADLALDGADWGTVTGDLNLLRATALTRLTEARARYDGGTRT